MAEQQLFQFQSFFSSLKNISTRSSPHTALLNKDHSLYGGNGYVNEFIGLQSNEKSLEKKKGEGADGGRESEYISMLQNIG